VPASNPVLMSIPTSGYPRLSGSCSRILGEAVNIDEWLLDLLACPACHAPLRADDAASELLCTSQTCGLAYPVRDDIPVLLVDEARRPPEAT
jgi:uncharacterized protein